MVPNVVKLYLTAWSLFALRVTATPTPTNIFTWNATYDSSDCGAKGTCVSFDNGSCFVGNQTCGGYNLEVTTEMLFCRCDKCSSEGNPCFFEYGSRLGCRCNI